MDAIIVWLLFFLIKVSFVELTLFICFNIEQIRKGTNYSRENRLCKIFIDFYSILYPFSFWALYCLSFQFTDSEDPIGILKLFLNEDGLCLIHVICDCLCIIVSNTYCVVFFFCLSSSCCQFLWIAHF
jgi:hypothetical protein